MRGCGLPPNRHLVIDEDYVKKPRRRAPRKGELNYGFIPDFRLKVNRLSWLDPCPVPTEITQGPKAVAPSPHGSIRLRLLTI